ncbi:protein of unknown function [Ekhidna lutea]|uniref:DUF4382 domain-containing protein n=1 Tax=Ekhidna lutea TaxID=447679 RepID=A0A239KF42_EKHLU|nr:DUF4382 domain-containing protein [Ekhidna lutea]SNT16976.1 protein of unknown function [Ekhidna lutea]
MKKLRLTSKLLGIALLTSLFACGDGSSEVSSNGKASVAVTDATVDAENVNSVNLSVSEVRATADGESRTIATFNSPKTFNLMAYQNGETYFLGEGDVEAGTYSDVRFILSGASDSYVEMKDGSRKDLIIENATTTGYQINGTFDVAANSTTNLVADIDLRKALVTQAQNSSETSFKLRSTARVVVEDATGEIKGSVEGQANSSERLVVYAYKKGSFSASEEDAPAEGRTRYEGSINSAVVAEDGSYTLAFMEEGDYEIIVASYSNTDDDEDLEFQGRVESELLIDGSLFNTLSVTSNTTVNANIMLK